MQSFASQNLSNPLRGLISDEVYSVLEKHNLLNSKGIRDYQIRHIFKKLKDKDIPTNLAIEHIQDHYPYLQYDTIRKIVYGLNKRY